jgi:hypothetical protein
MISSFSCVVVSISGLLASIGMAAARRSQGHKWRNLILVLEATVNGPRNGSRRPA